jgi:AAA+ ATPase superfamily predicted ATPase
MVSKRFEEMLQSEMMIAVHSGSLDFYDFISTLEAAAMSAKQLAVERVEKEHRADFARGLVVSQLKSLFEIIESDEKNILPYADYIDKDKVFADFAKGAEDNLPQDADDFKQFLLDALERFLKEE